MYFQVIVTKKIVVITGDINCDVGKTSVLAIFVTIVPLQEKVTAVFSHSDAKHFHIQYLRNYTNLSAI
jgi:hypothetical protein